MLRFWQTVGLTTTSRSCMIDHRLSLLVRVYGTRLITIYCGIIKKRLLFRYSRILQAVLHDAYVGRLYSISCCMWVFFTCLEVHRWVESSKNLHLYFPGICNLATYAPWKSRVRKDDESFGPDTEDALHITNHFDCQVKDIMRHSPQSLRLQEDKQ